MRPVLVAANIVWTRHGQELVVTSGLDGTHSAGSYHYYGFALDLRTRYFITIEEVNEVAEDLRQEIRRQAWAKFGVHGADAYVVIVEKDHMHVHYIGDAWHVHYIGDA